MSKSDRRKALRAALSGMSQADQWRESGLVCQRLIQFLSTRPNLKTIGTFCARGTEVDIGGIEPFLRARGVRLALPWISPTEAGQMEFREFAPHAELVPNRYGIPEPGEGSAFLHPSELDLILVPGLGFTSQLTRLGRGAGYYDRYLADCPSALKIGVGFSCQLVDEIETESTDISLDGLILPHKEWIPGHP